MTLELGRSRLRETAMWLQSLGEDWRGEIPLRIHENTPGGLGAAPPFAPEFISFIGHLECEVPGCEECIKERTRQRDSRPRAYGNRSRTRATKAFRKLRRFAPREFDALYMYCILGKSIAEISARFTNEDYARGLPDPVTKQAVSVLLISGIDKVRTWW